MNRSRSEERGDSPTLHPSFARPPQGERELLREQVSAAQLALKRRHTLIAAAESEVVALEQELESKRLMLMDTTVQDRLMRQMRLELQQAERVNRSLRAELEEGEEDLARLRRRTVSDVSEIDYIVTIAVEQLGAVEDKVLHFMAQLDAGASVYCALDQELRKLSVAMEMSTSALHRHSNQFRQARQLITRTVSELVTQAEAAVEQAEDGGTNATPLGPARRLRTVRPRVPHGGLLDDVSSRSDGTPSPPSVDFHEAVLRFRAPHPAKPAAEPSPQPSRAGTQPTGEPWKTVEKNRTPTLSGGKDKDSGRKLDSVPRLNKDKLRKYADASAATPHVPLRSSRLYYESTSHGAMSKGYITHHKF